MKNFLKTLGAIVAVIGVVLGALVIFDKYSNRNKIKGDYLECDVLEDEEEIEE